VKKHQNPSTKSQTNSNDRNSKYETVKFDGIVKNPLGRHPGESRGPEQLEILDSGFRRNDAPYGIFESSRVHQVWVN
jgi:hypothetical protein